MINARLPIPSGVTPPPATNQVMWLRKGLGQTTSQWDDQTGLGHHLALTNTPTLNGDGSIGFNGTNQNGSVTFTLVQPFTVWARMRQVTWTSGDELMDGVTGTCVIEQNSTTPDLLGFGGNSIGPVAGPTVNTYFTFGAVWSAGASLLSVNGTETAGNLGGNNPGGITLASLAGNTANSNVDYMEVVVYDIAADATLRALLNTYMGSL